MTKTRGFPYGSRFGALSFLLCVSAIAAGGDAGKTVRPKPWPRSYSCLQRGEYLVALQALREGGPEQDTGTLPQYAKSWRFQQLAVALGAVGCFREAQQAYSRGLERGEIPPEPTAAELRELQTTSMEPAEQAIFRAVRQHQIVVLNETHAQPEHRAFGARLMPQLKDLGVRYLAIEQGTSPVLTRRPPTGE